MAAFLRDYWSDWCRVMINSPMHRNFWTLILLGALVLGGGFFIICALMLTIPLTFIMYKLRWVHQVSASPLEIQLSDELTWLLHFFQDARSLRKEVPNWKVWFPSNASILSSFPTGLSTVTFPFIQIRCKAWTALFHEGCYMSLARRLAALWSHDTRPRS